MIVIDTSLFTDFLVNFNEDRHRKARMFFDKISGADFIIYEPFLFDIELVGILRRKFNEKLVSEIIENLKDKIKYLDEISIHKMAFNVAMKMHCRAIDTYFIATAKLTDSILITNDRIMSKNARNYGVECYYLIEEFDRAIERLDYIK